MYVAIDFYHSIDALLKFNQTEIKHANEKDKTKLVSGPIVRVIHQSIKKRRHFENFNFYKVLYGERASLARSVCLPKTNLIKTTIFILSGASRYFGV